MVTCPSCGATVQADFGMVTCSACENVFMVEIDGTVSQPYEEAGANEAEAYVFETEAVEDAQVDSGDAFAAMEPTESSEVSGETEYALTEPELEPEPELPSDVETLEYAVEPQQDETIEEAPTEYSEDFLNALDSQGAPAPVDAAADPLGVTRFDANEASQLVDGPYFYDLKISGIDTALLKQQVIESLSDKRLNWSPDEIKKMIKMGCLELDGLNPVRAVLAVLRLQSLDVDVEWSQRPFTADPDPEQEMG